MEYVQDIISLLQESIRDNKHDLKVSLLTEIIKKLFYHLFSWFRIYKILFFAYIFFFIISFFFSVSLFGAHTI